MSSLPSLEGQGRSSPSSPGWTARLPLLAAAAVAVLGALAPFLGDGLPVANADVGPVEAPARAVATSGSTARSSSEIDREKEYRVKAALLFNFLKYATFPKGTFKDADPKKPDPIVVLVVGKDPFGPKLEKALSKKSIDGRAIHVMRSAKPPKELEAHIVFAGKLSADETKALIASSVGTPCLLIGESKGFAKKGGFINFYTSKGKIRFEVNTSRQSDTGVRLAAPLLKLARVIEGDPLPKERKKGASQAHGGDE